MPDVDAPPSGRLLARPRLDRLTREVVQRRLTTIVADAGFGKTTLLRAWSSDRTSAMVALDPADRTVSALAGGISRALAARVPAAAEGLAAAVRGRPGRASEEASRAEAVASLLCESVGPHLRDDLLLMVDDVHELTADDPAVRLAEAIVRHAPQRLHVVLAGRETPPFAVDRLRGQGQLLELSGGVLAFDEEEIADLLAASLDDAARRLAPSMLSVTGGWPAAVRLAIEAMQGLPASRRDSALRELRSTAGPLIGSLVREVVERQPGPARELLRRTAPLDRFNAELCAALGVEDAPAILGELARRGSFVQPLGEGWFRVNDLVRDEVREQLPLDEDEARVVQQDAAAWFDARGRLDEALARLIAAGEPEAIRRFLLRRGSDALASGAIRGVIRAGDLLDAMATPTPTPRGTTRRGEGADASDESLDALLGEALLLNGDTDRALARFERSAGRDRPLSAALAWRIGLMRYLRGELQDAHEAFMRGRIDGEPAQDATLLLAWTATVRWLLGRIDESRATADRAYELATATGDDRGLAAVHTVLAMLASLDGDGPAVESHSEAALVAADRAGDVLQTIRIRTNRASHRADEGRAKEALEDLDEAIRRAEVAGFAFFQALALSNRGQVRTTLGQLEAATVDLDASRAIYRRMGSRSAHYPVLGMAEVHRLRGDLVAARAAYEDVIAAAEQSGDLQTLTPALAGLARIVARDDPAAATELARRAVATGTRPAHGRALLAAGWVALARGDRTEAESMAAGAAAEAGRRHDDPGLAEAIELRAALLPAAAAREALEEALAIWQRIGDPIGAARVQLTLARRSPRADDRMLAVSAERRLAELGVRVTAAAAAAGALAHLPVTSSASVSIRTLGTFAVLREGEPVPTGEWQSRKARDLLKLLVARRGRSIAREVLMDALWPDEDPERLGNRLSVALATVRGVLDPAKRHPADRFVAADTDSVRLDLTALVVDVERFLADAAVGLRSLEQDHEADALPLLAAAEAAYTGDFLEEDPYQDWANPLREEARAAYIAVAHALADIARRAGDADSVARYELRILERDPYDEPAHLRLVTALARAGHHGEARRHYRAYGARMREIDVEAVPYPVP